MPPVPQPPEEAPESPATPETAETTAPAAPAPDFDRIYERMDELSSQQAQIAEQLGTVYERTEPPEEEPLFYDEAGELTEDGVRAVVNEYVDAQIEARMAPREAARLEQERDDEWDALVQDIPALEDESYARELIAEAAAWANAHNPGLIARPEFIDVIEDRHWRRVGRETAAAQTPVQQGVVLESAQGAAQQSKGSEVDWGDRIVKAAERLRPQI